MAKARITIEIEIEEDGKVPAGTQLPIRVFKSGGSRKMFRELLALADAAERSGNYKEAEAIREHAWNACTRDSKARGFRVWD